jgi:hypothetical protein
MKNIVIILAVSVCTIQLYGQGSLRITKGATIKTSGAAYIVLNNMNIVNNGSFKQTTGNGFVKLTGGSDVNVTGDSITSINQLILFKTAPSTFNLLKDMQVVTYVDFTGGVLNLNNNVLNLGNTGSFMNESEVSRAFTSGLGYVQVSGIINTPLPVNLGNLGAIITTNDNMGNTIIKRGHKSQTVSPSNNSILRYYDIIPTNNNSLHATLRFRYFDAELNSLTENTLYLWRNNNQVNWDVLTPDSRNVTINYIERNNISKFDRMTLSRATPPGITCPANITVNATQNGCKALVSFAASATGIPAPTITYNIGNTTITSPYAFSKGTTTVTATASNGVLPNATCAFTVTVVCGKMAADVGTPVTISEKTIDKFSLAARPNPSSHYFTLDIKSGNARGISIRVLDAVGRLLTIRSNVPPNSTVLIGHNYRPGIYYVEAFQGKEKLTIRLVKQ